MSRSDLRHGPISVEIVIGAVAMRLLEIGEAVKGVSPEPMATEPDIQWSNIASNGSDTSMSLRVGT